MVIGEMCPQAAAGRPAIAPLVMRAATWVDAQADLANVVERGSVPRFLVFGIDGKVAGVFDTIGLTDLGISQQVASGTYVGGLPCTARSIRRGSNSGRKISALPVSPIAAM